MSDNKNITVTISMTTIVRVLLLGVLIVAIIKLKSLVLVILTSIVLASFVQSAVHKVKRFIPNRALAVFSIYLLSLAALIGLFSVFIPVFLGEMSSLITQLGPYVPNSSILNTFSPDSISGAKDVAHSISENGSLVDVIRTTNNLASSFSG